MHTIYQHMCQYMLTTSHGNGHGLKRNGRVAGRSDGTCTHHLWGDGFTAARKTHCGKTLPCTGAVRIARATGSEALARCARAGGRRGSVVRCTGAARIYPHNTSCPTPPNSCDEQGACASYKGSPSIDLQASLTILVTCNSARIP